jgi:hypothetical protein
MKICLVATLFITNPKWTSLGLNPGKEEEKETRKLKVINVKYATEQCTSPQVIYVYKFVLMYNSLESGVRSEDHMLYGLC